jgi:hypothetical protein
MRAVDYNSVHVLRRALSFCAITYLRSYVMSDFIFSKAGRIMLPKAKLASLKLLMQTSNTKLLKA